MTAALDGLYYRYYDVITWSAGNNDMRFDDQYEVYDRLNSSQLSLIYLTNLERYGGSDTAHFTALKHVAPEKKTADQLYERWLENQVNGKKDMVQKLTEAVSGQTADRLLVQIAAPPAIKAPAAANPSKWDPFTVHGKLSPKCLARSRLTKPNWTRCHMSTRCQNRNWSLPITGRSG